MANVTIFIKEIHRYSTYNVFFCTDMLLTISSKRALHQWKITNLWDIQVNVQIIEQTELQESTIHVNVQMPLTVLIIIFI